MSEAGASELDHVSMDLEQDVISVADNACCESGPSTVVMEEENFAASGGVQGMDVEQREQEKQIEEEDGHKAEVSSSGALVVGVAAGAGAAAEEEEQSPDRPPSRPRRSDASRLGLRTSAKTRSSSLTSGKAGGTRKRGEDGEDLRSSSEELNNISNHGGGGGADGDDEVDGTGYRCGICNEDFESAKSLSLHKKCHPQYTLRRNPKRSRKLIDQEFAVDAAGAGVPAAAGGAATAAATGSSGGSPAAVQAAPISKKTSSMSEEFPRPCTECGKEFASWKALFGHMRCHPEREWRGIQAPTEKNQHGHSDSAQGSGGAAAAPASFHRRRKPQLPPPPAPSVITYQEDNVIEKSVSLESKRARNVNASKASDNESDTDSFEAAYMTNGDRHTVTSWMTGKRSKRSRQTHRSLDAVNNAKKELSSNVMMESSDMIEALMLLQSAKKELTIPFTPDSHKSRSKSRTPESGLALEAEELSAKRVKLEPDVASPCNDTEDGGDDFDAGEQGSSARSKYECTTCHRQFKSHQALGGHRASHKKVKGCFARTNVSDGAAHEQSVDDSMTEPEDDVKSEDDDQQQQQQLALTEAAETTTTTSPTHNTMSEEDSPAKPCYLTTARDDNEEMLLSLARKAKAHECTICHRVFASGQALGGHKRCHWGGVGVGGSLPEVTSKTTTTTGRTLKEGSGVQLDLNLPAPECLEEEEAAAGMSYSFFDVMHKTTTTTTTSPTATAPSQAADAADMTQFASSFDPYDTMKPTHVVATMALVPGLTPTSA